MTKQQITYDFAVSISERIRDHLIKQKTRASKPYNDDDLACTQTFCAYRGDSGTMCAVGCLIEDEHYTPDMERKNAGSHDVSNGVAKSLGIDLDLECADDDETRRIYAFIGMLDSWQNFHDGFADGQEISTDVANYRHNGVVERLKHKLAEV